MRGLCLLSAVVLVALVASACGSSEQTKPATKILSDARSAAQSAKSVHVVGSANGASIDLTIAGRQGARGMFAQSGQTIQLIRTASTAYLQATQQFYRQHGAPAALAQQLNGRWLKVSASRPDLASFVQLTDPAQLFPRVLRAHGTVTKRGEVSVDGTKAIRLIDGSNGALDVSASGKPYPLKLSGPGGSFSFSDWDKSVAIKAPAGALDVSSLG